MDRQANIPEQFFFPSHLFRPRVLGLLSLSWPPAPISTSKQTTVDDGPNGSTGPFCRTWPHAEKNSQCGAHTRKHDESCCSPPNARWFLSAYTSRATSSTPTSSALTTQRSWLLILLKGRRHRPRELREGRSSWKNTRDTYAVVRVQLPSRWRFPHSHRPIVHYSPPTIGTETREIKTRK